MDRLEKLIAEEADKDLEKIFILPPKICQSPCSDVEVERHGEHMHEIFADLRLTGGAFAVSQSVDLWKDFERAVFGGDDADDLLSAEGLFTMLENARAFLAAERTGSSDGGDPISRPFGDLVIALTISDFAPFKDGSADHSKMA